MTEQKQAEDLYAGMAAATDGPEQEPAAEEITEATPDDETPPPKQDEQAEGDEGDGEPEAGIAKEGKPKRGKTAAERIDELTKARREAEREAAAKDAELQKLRAMIEPKPKEKAEPLPPSPDDFDQGEFDPAFIRATARYEAQQEMNERLAQFKAEQERQNEQDSATERREKFIAACRSDEQHGASAYELLLDESAPVTQPVADIILESESGPRLAAFLNENRDQLSRISALPAHMQAYELGKIERSTQPATAETLAGEPVQMAKPTKAPAPTPTVTGRKASTSRAPSEMSQADYNEWANKREAAQRSSGW